MRKWALLLILCAIPLLAQPQDVKQAEIDSLKAELQETQARLDSLIRTNNPIDLGNRLTEAYEAGTKTATTIFIIISAILGVVAALGGFLGIKGIGQARRAGEILSEVKEARNEISKAKIEIENISSEAASSVKIVRECEEKAKGQVEKLKKTIDKVNEFSKMISRFKKKIEGMEGDLASLIYMVHGQRHIAQGEYKEALEIFAKATKENPRNSEAWYMKGVALGRLDKYKEAITACDKAITLKPNDAKIHNGRAAILGKWGDSLKGGEKEVEAREKYEMALESLNKALEFKKDSPAIYSNCARALYELERYEEALEASEKALSLNPKDAKAYFYRGRIFFERSEYTKALKDFNTSIKLNPRRVLAHLLKGLTLYKLNRLDEALGALDETLNLDPLIDSAYRFKAIIFASQGDYEEALEACEDAIQIKPNDGVLYSNKAFILNRLGRHKEARVLAAKAIELSEGGNGHFAMACAMSGLSELDDALKHLEESAKRGEYQGFIPGLGKDPWKEDSLKPLREERTEEFLRIVGPPPEEVEEKPKAKRKAKRRPPEGKEK